MATVPEKYYLSHWEHEVYFKDIDIVVIGSGIVGLTAAWHIRQLAPSLRVAVFERGALPVGASTRNAGFACFGSMTELLADCKRMGEDAVWSLVEKRWRGLKRLRSRIGDGPLQFRQAGGYELFTEDDEETYEACLDQLSYVNRQLAGIIGQPEVFRRADEAISRFGFRRVQHLLFNVAEGQLHPGWMVDGLQQLVRSAGIRIITGFPVHALEDDGQGVTLRVGPDWELRVGRVLVATNGFARQLLPDLQVQPARNQVLITHPVAHLPLDGCFHYDQGYYYFRNVGNRVLLGGGRNLAELEEQTPELGITPLIRAALTRLLHEIILPNHPVEIDRWWSGVLGLDTKEKAPIITKVSPNVAVAVRLGGMGVAIGSLVGEEGAEVLLG